jgi:hypothetical protein
VAASKALLHGSLAPDEFRALAEGGARGLEYRHFAGVSTLSTLVPIHVVIERLNPCGVIGETAVLIRAVSRWSRSNQARPARTTA